MECGRRNTFVAFPVPAIAFCSWMSHCVLHVTAGSRIVRTVSKCSWMSLTRAVLLCFAHDGWSSHCKGCLQVLLDACVVISCFASVRRQPHCNCNAHGVHASIFLTLAAFIFLLKL